MHEHEHVFVLSADVQQNYPAEWGSEDERVADAVTRLTALHALGVSTIVDPTVVGLGRYIPRIARIAEQVDLQIVVATGLYNYGDASEVETELLPSPAPHRRATARGATDPALNPDASVRRAGPDGRADRQGAGGEPHLDLPGAGPELVAGDSGLRRYRGASRRLRGYRAAAALTDGSGGPVGQRAADGTHACQPARRIAL